MSFHQILMDESNLKEANRTIRSVCKQLNIKPTVAGYDDDSGTEILIGEFGCISFSIDYLNNRDDMDEDFRSIFEIDWKGGTLRSDFKHVRHAANTIKKLANDPEYRQTKQENKK